MGTWLVPLPFSATRKYLKFIQICYGYRRISKILGVRLKKILNLIQCLDNSIKDINNNINNFNKMIKNNVLRINEEIKIVEKIRRLEKKKQKRVKRLSELNKAKVTELRSTNYYKFDKRMLCRNSSCCGWSGISSRKWVRITSRMSSSEFVKHNGSTSRSQRCFTAG